MSHIHILRRVAHSKDWYMCFDPNCTWTRRREFLIGKKAKCPQCGQEYLLTLDALRLKIPHCSNCTVKREAGISVKALKKLVNIVEEERI